MKIITLLSVCVLFVFGLSLDVSAENKVDTEIARIRVKAIKAYNNRDIDALMSIWHKDGRIIGRAGPKPDIVNGYDQLKAFYLAQFESPHFSHISMSSEDSELIDGIYYDSGTLSILNKDGKEFLKGCYVMLFKKENDYFIAWREYSYPFCMNTKHH